MNNMTGMLGKLPQETAQDSPQSMAGMLGIGQSAKMGGMLGNLQGGQGAPMSQGAMPPQQQGMQQAQAAPQQGGSQQAMQMAQMLAQSPTPETVQMVVGELMKKGTPEAQQIADVLMQVQSSPESVTKVAQAIMQQMQGGQQAGQ